MVIVGKCQISLSKMAKIKRKNLFDHINAITSQQHSNYWDDISDEDKKSWSNYMVNRFLSMKMEWIEFVNEVQKYPLKPKELYKVYGVNYFYFVDELAIVSKKQILKF